MPISKPALDALIAYIREEGPYILASSGDADYFRKSFRKSEPICSEPIRSKSIRQEPICSEPVRPEPAQPKTVAVPALKVELPKQALPKPIVNFSSVRNILSVIAPELALLDEIPSDAIAKKISERWKTKNQTAPISIVIYQEPPEQRAFLEEIAKALDIYFGPAKIVNGEEIEKEKQWEAFLSVEGLKMIIVCDYTLWQLGNLMRFYKETPAQGTRLLGNAPLFLLPDLSLYLKDALLKRSLWKALCQKCL